MTNEQILKKATEKAMKNGFSYGLNTKRITYQHLLDVILVDTFQFPDAYKSIIFSHDFAKAFWGEEDVMFNWGYDLPEIVEPAWRIHLMYMVLEKEPLKYLKKFL